MSHVACNNQGTGETKARLYRVFAQLGKYLLHWALKVNHHRFIKLRSLLRKEFPGFCLELLNEDAFGSDFPLDIAIGAATDSYANRA